MTHSTHAVPDDLRVEMKRLNLGDRRLEARAHRIMGRFQAMPEAAFPKMMSGDAELEGAYRFLGNPRVTSDALLAPHLDGTADRVRELRESLVLHDTSEVSFNRTEHPDDMGYITSKHRGFHIHASLAVQVGTPNLPLGLLACSFLHRAQERKPKVHPRERAQQPDRESLRWLQGVREARARVGPDVELIHVMDREADDYTLLAGLIEDSESFVIRVRHNRIVDDGSGASKIFAVLEGEPAVAVREVALSSRGESELPQQRKFHPARDSRMATLHVRHVRVKLKRPSGASTALPSEIDVTVVHVFEPHPPEGEAPIDWKIVTDRQVATAEDALAVVDVYRQRWLIEEFFKALKTGTDLTSRQVESVHAIHNVIALSLPIAWRLLVLRAHARRDPDLPARVVLNDLQLTLLRTMGRRPLSDSPTLGEASYAVAALAGHLRRNGPPGWRLLGEGLRELLRMEEVWLAMASSQRDAQRPA
jgi:hypothetical protein